VLKLFKRKKKILKLSKEQLLKSKPFIPPDVEWKQYPSGEVAIILRRKESLKWKILGPLLRVPKVKKIMLDEIGSKVWLWCDGKTTIRQMIERLSEEHKMSLREAELSLVTYLTILSSKKLVIFKLEEGGEKQSP